MNNLLKVYKTDNNLAYIREFLLYLKSDKGCRPSSIEAYAADLEEFNKHFSTKDLLELKEKDIREYKYHLADRELAPRTINRKISVIRSFYSYFANHDDWEITKNPAKNIPRTKVPKTIPITLSASQAETLLDGILLTGMFAARDYAIFSTFLFTALRVSELIKLDIQDIDFERALLHIREGKGGKDRKVPILPRLASALQYYLHHDTVYKTSRSKKQSEKEKVRIDRSLCGRGFFVLDKVEQALFLTKEGKRFTEEGIAYLFKTYAKNLQIYKKGLSLHALRRSCLTFLYREGVDLFTLKEISGHTQVQTLEHYIHVDSLKVKQALAKHPLANQGLDWNLMKLMREKR